MVVEIPCGKEEKVTKIKKYNLLRLLIIIY